MNTSVDYGGVLRRAWQITWKHKILWIFGILAGCSRGGSGGGSGNNNVSVNQRGGIDLPPEMQQFQQNIERFFNQDQSQWLPWVVGISCVVLLIVVALYFLGLIGEGGLIHGAAVADRTGAITFGEAWSVGTRKAIPLFLMRLLVGVPTAIVIGLLVLLGVLGTVGTAGLGVLCLIPLICLLVPAAIVVGIWEYFATYYIVLQNVGVVDSLRQSWGFLRQRWQPVLILGLINFVIAFVLGLVLAAPFLLAVLPTMAIIIGNAAQNVQPNFSAFLPALVCGGLYLPVLIVLSGVLTTWLTSGWTVLFNQLHAPAQAEVIAPPAA